MLETERAGAKALVVFLDDYARDTDEWKVLRRVQSDEARNCAVIGKLLDLSGTPHSHATGPFFEKAISVKGKKEKIEFLVKGLRWAVRRFEGELPKLDQASQDAFAKMRDTHLRSIAACETVARRLS